ncbi:MAG: cation:proton antiporter [Spirochaetales bacterium]
MLFSLAMMVLGGILFSELFQKIKLPAKIGMIICGVIMGPHVLNWIDKSLINDSTLIRDIALIIILSRAALMLDRKDLKKAGRPTILLCFVPACIEILGVVLLAPHLLGVSIIDAAIMGSVVAAVSPTVIVPRMIKISQESYGVEKSIPQMIMASASVDNVFVIVLFTCLIGFAAGSNSWQSFAEIPLSIVLGTVVGIIVGIGMHIIFKSMHMRDSQKILIFLGFGLLFVAAQNSLSHIIPFSGFISILSMGIALRTKYSNLADRLATRCDKIWVFAQIMLYVSVGATVDISTMPDKFGFTVILIIAMLFFRMIGVFLSLIGTKLNNKEKLFCVLSYTPKSTVQAAFGSIPLSMGLSSGNIILSLSVLSIMITAPLGGQLIAKTYKKLLSKMP